MIVPSSFTGGEGTVPVFAGREEETGKGGGRHSSPF